jgi:phosphatidate cytidylyltransferase
MFMQRLITSLILIPLVLLILFYGPTWFLIALIILVLLAAGRECWQLIPLRHPATKIGFLLLLLAGIWVCGFVFTYWLVAGLCVWGLIFTCILTFPKSQDYWGHPPIVAGICFMVLPLFLQSLIHLYQVPNGKGLILYLLCIVWAADIGAYLAGKRWGKHKLIPQVSPGKSWEGAAGGLFLVVLVAIVGWLYFRPTAPYSWFLLALGCAVISIFGDLFVSILKRRCHLKDTGTLIPGHGGVLDRLDSLIAGMPFFYFGLKYLM